MIYLLYGVERKSMDRSLLELKNKYQCSFDSLNYSVYDLDNEGMKEVYDDLMTPAFFSEYKMVVVKNPNFLTTNRIKKDNTNDIDYLEKWLENDNSQSILVLFYPQTNIDKRKKIYKTLQKKAKIIEFSQLDEKSIEDNLRIMIRNNNSRISNDALKLLVSRCNRSLLQAQNEADKLSLYSKDISLSDVEKLVVKPLDEEAYLLSSALLKKDRVTMYQIYHDLVVLKEEPIKIIVTIANALRLIYQVKVLDRKGYNDKEIAKMLGINPYRLFYIRKDTNNFSLDDILYLLTKLAELDMDIKKGKIDKQKGLELFLMRI